MAGAEAIVEYIAICKHTTQSTAHDSTLIEDVPAQLLHNFQRPTNCSSWCLLEYARIATNKRLGSAGWLITPCTHAQQGNAWCPCRHTDIL